MVKNITWLIRPKVQSNLYDCNSFMTSVLWIHQRGHRKNNPRVLKSQNKKRFIFYLGDCFILFYISYTTTVILDLKIDS